MKGSTLRTLGSLPLVVGLFAMVEDLMADRWVRAPTARGMRGCAALNRRMAG